MDCVSYYATYTKYGRGFKLKLPLFELSLYTISNHLIKGAYMLQANYNTFKLI
jgi:hypothetical protein